MNPLILTHVGDPKIQKAVTDFLDKRFEVRNWYTPWPGFICIVAEITSRQFDTMLHEGLPWLFFSITDYNRDTVGGWLPKSVWHFLNNPTASGTDMRSHLMQFAMPPNPGLPPAGP